MAKPSPTYHMKSLKVLLAFMLCALLLALSSVFCTKTAHAATLQRGDVSRAASGGIVLDTELHTKQPHFNKPISTSSAPNSGTADIVYTYCYALSVPAKTYKTLGTTLSVRWDNVGFDADDDRIDLVVSWLPDSKWYSLDALSQIPLLQRYDKNGYNTAGICIGINKEITGSQSCCEQHIKIEFFKHATSNHARGSFLTKITDLDKRGWSEGYTDRWCESIEFISGHGSDMYIPASNVLNIGSNRNGEASTDYRATQEMDGSSLDSGVVASLSSGAEFWYYSSHGWTDILDQFDPQTITLSSTKGGAVHCSGKTGLVPVGWRGNRTISIEASSGYKIAEVRVDGSSIGTPSSYTFTSVTEDHTVEARFVPTTYTITFDPNGAKGNMSDLVICHGESQYLTKNTFIRPGYLFTGWNTQADGSGTRLDDGEEILDLSAVDGATIPLYAQWKPIEYEIAFDGNSATGTMSRQRFIYDQHKSLSVNQFSRTGYLFAGWNTRADGSGTHYADLQEVSNLSSTPSDTITLYAQWAPVTYYVVFDAQGGSGAMVDQLFIYDQAEALQRNVLHRSGYRWVTWNTHPSIPETNYTDGQLVKNLAERANETVTLYAIWAANRCLIVYDGNGGAGSMHAQSLAYGTAETLYPNEFERDGYQWTSWNTRPDGSGISYDNEAKVQDLSMIDNSVITLYAQWKHESRTDAQDPDTQDPDQDESEQPNDHLSENSPSNDVTVNDPTDDPSSSTTDEGDNSSIETDATEASNADTLNELAEHEEDLVSTQTALDTNLQGTSSASPYAKTGGAVGAMVCCTLAGVILGAALMIHARRKKQHALEKQRRLFQKYLKP